MPDLLPLRVDTQLLKVSRTARDRLALAILLDLGVRKSELGRLMVRDLDLGRRILTVFGKGQKERILPVRGRLVLMAEAYLLTELPEFTAISNGERTREVEAYYGHYDLSDLERAMEQFASRRSDTVDDPN